MKKYPIRRLGFTMIEVVVAVGIISILMGLTLPAVRSAREAARRATCQSHLHQIGLAIHGYHEAFNCFPRTLTAHFTPSSTYDGYYSIHARLLPYVGEVDLYNAINFASGTSPKPSSPSVAAANALNQTVLGTRIALFLCPSDGGPGDRAGTNYRGNTGVGPNISTMAEFPDSDNGLFPVTSLVRAAYVPDGLSHTAAFSERLRGTDREETPASERDVWPSHGYVPTADAQIKECQIEARPDAKEVFVTAGWYWFWYGRRYTLYCHGQPPNGRVPDCLSLSTPGGLGMITARSAHPGGVNVLMGDGSCRWVSSAISLPVWRGLGTRNGRELVD